MLLILSLDHKVVVVWMMMMMMMMMIVLLASNVEVDCHDSSDVNPLVMSC